MGEEFLEAGLRAISRNGRDIGNRQLYASRAAGVPGTGVDGHREDGINRQQPALRNASRPASRLADARGPARIESKGQALSFLLTELGRSGLPRDLRSLIATHAAQLSAASPQEGAQLLGSVLHVLRGQIRLLGSGAGESGARIDLDARDTRVRHLESQIRLLGAIKTLAHFWHERGGPAQ